MKIKVDLEKWERKEHFRFFSEFDDPFFNLTTKLECTELYSFAKKNNLSFFLCYLYASLKAANETEEFRMRIEENGVIIHDVIQASPVIMLEDNSFLFAYFNYSESLNKFHSESKKIIDHLKTTRELIPSDDNSDVIHYSAIPWIEFTGLKHPRRFGTKDSIPKITFGRLGEESGKKMLPINVEANHALMDAYHLSQFFERFTLLMKNPADL